MFFDYVMECKPYMHTPFHGPYTGLAIFSPTWSRSLLGLPSVAERVHFRGLLFAYLSKSQQCCPGDQQSSDFDEAYSTAVPDAHRISLIEYRSLAARRACTCRVVEVQTRCIILQNSSSQACTFATSHCSLMHRGHQPWSFVPVMSGTRYSRR